MPHYGIAYAINRIGVTSPDEEVWAHNVLGNDLNATQKRSIYSRLEWRKTVTEECDLDWFEYDNTTLTSLTTRPPDSLVTHEIYTDAICQSVVMRHRRGVGNEMVATFLVNLRDVVT